MTAAHDNLRRGAPRQGFTLIELLMVILLVGILASLLLVAINAAMRRAQNAAVQSEINQMATAVENFKADHGAYPLTLGYTLYDDSPFSRSNRFLRHLSKVFPRYIPTPVPPAKTPIEAVEADIAAGTQYRVDAGVSPGRLSLGDLDPAESLVFWLGGFPDPNSETKLIGFRSDPANPFKYPTGSDYLKNRTPPAFPFNPKRLVDRDQDGWWEYIQDGTAEGDMPPYVYFDSSTYNLRPFYPQTSMPSANTINWGHALPYATSDTQQQFNAGNAKVLWVNSQKFQIVAPGRGGSYGQPLPNSLTGSPLYKSNPTPAEMRPINQQTRLWPTCTLLNPSGGSGAPLPDFELDNLTNFSSSELGAERE